MVAMENKEERPGFAGYRIVEFGRTSRDTLKEVAEVLAPHEWEIIEGWIGRQFSAWEPPGLSRHGLKQIFGSIFHNMLRCMGTGKLESCIADLEEAGADLANRNFPYEALIISMHFLEESYLGYLLDQPSAKTLKWLLEMDEFLHAALAAIATSYFQVYRKELLEEAEVGHIVQEGLLSDIPKRVLNLEVAHIYSAAGDRAQVGGDFIDLLELDDQKIAFIVGDLSGHGLGAATDAAMLRFLFRGFIRENPDPAIAMTRLNRILLSELEEGQFATAIAGVYDESGGRLHLSSAGQPAPVLCDGRCYLLEPGGIVLAASERSTYSLDTIELAEGAVFVAYTDGLIEARRNNSFFGEERVVGTVNRMRDASARTIAEYLSDEALRFAGGKLTDDVAILVLKRISGH